MGECIRIWKRLDPFWKHSDTTDRDKNLAYDSIIKAKLLYGLETANLTKGKLETLDIFFNKEALGKS